MDNIPTWVAFLASSIVGIIAGILVQFFIVPWQRKKILGHSQTKKPVKFSIEGSSGECVINRYSDEFSHFCKHLIQKSQRQAAVQNVIVVRLL